MTVDGEVSDVVGGWVGAKSNGSRSRMCGWEWQARTDTGGGEHYRDGRFLCNQRWDVSIHRESGRIQDELNGWW